MTPLVSIIIPTYNRAHLIGETLESLIAQSNTNWECIIVDDGSTDDTLKLLNNYCKKDNRVQIHLRPKYFPKGANACRNFGYDLCKGEYIQWFDSDDLMHPDKLKIKLEMALKYQSDVIIDTHSTEDKIVLIDNPKIETFESAVFYIDYILGKKPVITNDVMVKRSIINELRFDEKLHKAQEYEFFSRLFNQNVKYCFIELSLTIYRETKDSISKNTSSGNVKQVESLIYLSELLKIRHSNNPQIVAKTEKQGRKTYKSLVLNRNLKLIIKHFKFLKDSHHKSTILFFGFIVYNYITKRGFDSIKP